MLLDTLLDKFYKNNWYFIQRHAKTDFVKISFEYRILSNREIEVFGRLKRGGIRIIGILRRNIT